MVRIAVLLGIFLVSDALALDPNRAMPQYLRDQWGAEQGFPPGPVYAISQTPDGYLWIGTGAGLVRFDGFNFQVVKDDSGAFTITSVLGLTTDNEGCLWLRLQDLSLLSYCNGTFEDPTRAPEHVTVASAAVASNRGGLLVAKVEKGLFRLRRDGFQKLAAGGDLQKSFVIALAQTPNGDVWMGTRSAGIYRLNNGMVSSITDRLPDPKVNCLLSEGDKDVWVGTDRGVVRWNGRELITAGVPAAPGHFQALSMVRDRDANIWVGTDSRGLLRFNSEGVARLNENDAVTALFEDREGDLWVGSASGLERLRDSTFVTISSPDGLRASESDPLFVDSENKIWFPPASGGLRWVKDGLGGHVTDAGLDQDVVYSIAGRNGELWLGRKRGGLTHLRMESGSFVAQCYTEADGLAQNSVYSVYQARDGTVWAGTLSAGVSKLSNEKFTTYSTANGLASNTVVSMLESSDGTMWFATPDGLSALSKGSWRTYGMKDGLPANNIDCLLEDSRGVLWVGTERGLAFRDSGTFRFPAGVPESMKEPVLAMAEDRLGWLWMSTSRHVLRVKRDNFMRDNLVDGGVREYGIADGLRGVEGVKRRQSVAADRQGRIWFSLNRGISWVDPARLTRDSVPAIIHLQTISADNSPVGMGTAVHIPGGSKRITIGFIGLSLSSPDRVRFRYQLDPFDHGWSDATAVREAVYTNLAPGRYRFRVIASNPEGVWSTSETAMGLEVDPLFWQTWWFRIAVVLAFASAVAAMYRMRFNQLTRQFNARSEERLAERTRIAQELHDTLLQGFLSASMHVHIATDSLSEDSQAKPILVRALELMGQVIEEGRNAIRGLRSSRTVSLDLEQALSSAVEDAVLRQPAGEQVDFRIIVNGERRPLHPFLRDEVYRIGREAIINAFRHAHAKRIDVELTYSSSLSLVVRDDGSGIDPRTVDSGRDGHWGLSGMRERADQLGARFHVFSSGTAGTEIELSVPGRIAFRDQRKPRLRWFGRREGQ